MVLGGAAAGFLIAVEEKLDGLVLRQQVQFLQGPERHVEADETALHVVDAGTEGVVILAGEGAVLGGPGGEDGVVMPDQQKLYRAVSHGPVKVEADIPGVDGLHGKAETFKKLLEIVPAEGLHGRIAIGVGFPVHHILQDAQELLQILRYVLRDFNAVFHCPKSRLHLDRTSFYFSMLSVLATRMPRFRALFRPISSCRIASRTSPF